MSSISVDFKTGLNQSGVVREHPASKKLNRFRVSYLKTHSVFARSKQQQDENATWLFWKTARGMEPAQGNFVKACFFTSRLRTRAKEPRRRKNAQKCQNTHVLIWGSPVWLSAGSPPGPRWLAAGSAAGSPPSPRRVPAGSPPGPHRVPGGSPPGPRRARDPKRPEKGPKKTQKRPKKDPKKTQKQNSKKEEGSPKKTQQRPEKRPHRHPTQPLRDSCA